MMTVFGLLRGALQDPIKSDELACAQTAQNPQLSVRAGELPERQAVR